MEKGKLIAAVLLLIYNALSGVWAIGGKWSENERIFLSTDRDIYIAGEDIYFSMFLLSGPDNVSSIAYLTLRNESNAVISSSPLRLENKAAYGRVALPDTLGTGVYHLSAFTNWMKNFGTESFANVRLIVVNRFDQEIDRSLSQSPGTNMTKKPLQNSEHGIKAVTCSEYYGSREQVTLTVEAYGHGSPVHLNIAVVPVLSVMNRLNCEFTETDIGVDPGKQVSQKVYLKEDEGTVISGTVFDENSGTGISDAIVLLNTPDTLLNLNYARSLDDGRFYFRLNNYYDGRDLYFSLLQQDRSDNLSLVIDDKISLPAPGRIPLTLDPEALEFISYSKDVVRVQKIYNTSFRDREIIHEQIPGAPPVIYSGASHTIFPENFEPLEDFREIARELISYLRVRRSGETFQIRMLDERAEYSLLRGEPAVFVNALPEININNIIDLGSDDIERIEIHNYDWVTGDIRFSGIAGIFTHGGEYGGLNSDRNFTVVHNEKLLPRSVPGSVNHSDPYEPLKEFPDFRQLLHWEPSVILDGKTTLKIQFYTGDLKGSYIIRVTGINDSGDKLSGTAHFEIR